MSRHTDEFLDLCAARALGALDPADEQRLDEHVAAGCPTCEAALVDFAQATIGLAGIVPAARPSPALRERVLASARSDKTRRVIALEPRHARRWVPAMLAAASIVLTATSVALWQRAQRLTGERDTALARLEEIAGELESSRRLERLLVSPHSDCFDLAATGAAEAVPDGRVCFDAASGDAILVFGRLAPPTGRDYELWVLRGDRPTSLGLVRADPSGRAVVRVGALADAGAVTAFAVSLEPQGGSPSASPTGPVVLVGARGG